MSPDRCRIRRMEEFIPEYVAALLQSGIPGLGIISTNGTDWEEGHKPQYFVECSAYGNGIFLLGGDAARIQKSTDIEAGWSVAASAIFGTGDAVKRLVYDPSTGLFTALSNERRTAQSANGNTWTASGLWGFSGATPITYSMANNKQGEYVVGARYGYIGHSTDGLTLSSQALVGSGTNFHTCVGFFKEKWFTVTAGQAFTSNNGTGWSLASSNFDSSSYRHSATSPDLVIVGGDNAAHLRMSVDGETWTAVPNNPFTAAGGWVTDVEYHPTTGWLITTFHLACQSFDGENWTTFKVNDWEQNVIAVKNEYNY